VHSGLAVVSISFVAALIVGGVAPVHTYTLDPYVPRLEVSCKKCDVASGGDRGGDAMMAT